VLKRSTMHALSCYLAAGAAAKDWPSPVLSGTAHSDMSLYMLKGGMSVEHELLPPSHLSSIAQRVALSGLHSCNPSNAPPVYGEMVDSCCLDALL